MKKPKRVVLGNGYLRHDFDEGFALTDRSSGKFTRADIFSGRIDCILNTEGESLHGKRIRLIAEVLE